MEALMKLNQKLRIYSKLYQALYLHKDQPTYLILGILAHI